MDAKLSSNKVCLFDEQRKRYKITDPAKPYQLPPSRRLIPTSSWQYPDPPSVFSEDGIKLYRRATDLLERGGIVDTVPSTMLLIRTENIHKTAGFGLTRLLYAQVPEHVSLNIH